MREVARTGWVGVRRGGEGRGGGGGYDEVGGCAVGLSQTIRIRIRARVRVTVRVKVR